MGNSKLPAGVRGHQSTPPFTDNGILAKLGGEIIGGAAHQLPVASAAEKDQPIRSVRVDGVQHIGNVRITYELNSYTTHGRGRQWHWRAVRADLIGGTA